MSISSDLRERFLAGEVLNQSDVAGEYGCSSSVLAMVRKSLEEKGHTFVSSERVVGRRKFIDWRLASANGQKETVVAEVEASPKEDRKNGALPLPALGQTVVVSVLAVSEAGVVSIGLRDGKRTWLCQLTSQS